MIRRNEATGEITFDPTQDVEEFGSCLKEIFDSTEVGQTFVRDYYTSELEDEQTAKLVRASRLVSGSENVSINDLARGLQLLIDSGEVQPREVEESVELAEPEEDTRPRGRNGQLLTEPQIRWREMREWSETHSADECRRRARTDAGYASYVRKQLAAEMSGGVGDAVTPAGTNTSSVAPPPADQSLVDFARKYQTEPSQNLRPRNGVVLLAGEQMPYATFLHLVNKATSARLL